MLKSCMARSAKRGVVDVKNINLTHKAKRPTDIVYETLDKLASNYSKMNYIEYFELKNIFNVKDIAEKLQNFYYKEW